MDTRQTRYKHLPIQATSHSNDVHMAFACPIRGAESSATAAGHVVPGPRISWTRASGRNVSTNDGGGVDSAVLVRREVLRENFLDRLFWEVGNVSVALDS